MLAVNVITSSSSLHGRSELGACYCPRIEHFSDHINAVKSQRYSKGLCKTTFLLLQVKKLLPSEKLHTNKHRQLSSIDNMNYILRLQPGILVTNQSI